MIPLDVETKESGAVVAFYDAQTGLLVSQHRIEDLSSPTSLVLRQGRKNVYVLGNIWLIDGNGELQEPSFPVREEDLQSFSYEFGAVPSENGCRTESYDETGEYGIPVRGVLKNVEVGAGTVIRITLERMFAKVRITVDHGGISRKDGAFKNEKLIPMLTSNTGSYDIWRILFIFAEYDEEYHNYGGRRIYRKPRCASVRQQISRVQDNQR